MESFNVLDRNQDVHRHYLLEASAGTGKTFSIENIVVRLLLEEDPETHADCRLDQILVVTFTRMATRDLKARIRSNIERSLAFFNRALNTPHLTTFPDTPDYLISYLEKGEEVLKRCKRALEQALFSFDQAQIFTIHGFCSRMLSNFLFEGDIISDAAQNQGAFSPSELLDVIRDFFRTELREDSYSLQQLKILSQAYEHSSEKLESALLKLINTGLEIAELPDFQTQLMQFKQVMQHLKQTSQFNSAKIIADFILHAPAYEKLCDRSRAVKAEPLQKVSFFAALFDQDTWSRTDFEQLLSDGLFIVEALDPSKLTAKGKPPEASILHYPNLIPQLKTALNPLIEHSRHPLHILSRMGRGCQKLLKRYLEEEERLGFDDLLKAMMDKLHNPLFAEKVRSHYKAAIIDEFQDTDPIQWKIFHTLFMEAPEGWGHLYLVGDPKQSIYAFRQADIYTYLAAAQALGSDHHASLDTNYRSQATLVQALNTLFEETATPGLISLPRIDSVLAYQTVKAGANFTEKEFSDTLGSIHFCLAEELKEASGRGQSLPLEKLETHYLLPFFAQEIQRLHDKDHFSFRQFAILVSDRFQAQRAADYLKQWQIPSAAQRNASLVDSQALSALQDLLKAVLHPKHESSLKTALGGKLMGWTHSEIEGLTNNPSLQEHILLKVYALRKLLVAEGFSRFFPTFMQSSWQINSSVSVLERLLAEEGGLDFYQELQQLAELLFDHQTQQYVSPEGWLQFLDRIPLLEIDGDERIKKRSDPTRDAVQILTLHSSKGLEFDIVFTLGLIKRSPAPSQLIPSTQGHALCLSPEIDLHSIPYQNHCRELDAEKIRQLYVGMTRAKYRLYAPVILVPAYKAIEEGSASPMELFLARLGLPETKSEHLYDRINGYDGKALCDFIDALAPEVKISYSCLKNIEQPLQHQQDVSAPQLTLTPAFEIPGQKQFIYSFTHLSKKSLGTARDSANDEVEKGQVIDEQPLKTPNSFAVAIKTPHTLPSSTEVGILFHRLLESIPFQQVAACTQPADLIPLVRPHLQGTVCADWEGVFSQILFNTLKTPLKIGDAIFPLCDIAADACYMEMEFLYPCAEHLQLEELESCSGFLKGIIDLIFYHHGKYYLLDWKSNWLGETAADYDIPHLEGAMRQHHYFLQASIYVKALENYLKMVDPRPFSEIFGGVIYLFLRGIDPTQQTGQSGVYHFWPWAF